MYLYKAIDKEGNLKEGELNLESREDVFLYLNALNFSVIDVKKVNFLNRDIKNIEIFKNKFKKRDTSVFCRQMAFTIGSGINILNGIDIIKNNSKNKFIKDSLNIIKEEILNGNSLSSSMEKSNLFESLLCNMVKIGEETGELETIMLKMSKHYENEANISEDIKSAMLYPVFVFISMMIVVIIALIYVIPNYSLIFIQYGQSLPLPTKILIGISNFINNYYLLILFLISLFLFAFWYGNKFLNFKTYKDKLILKIPLLNKPINKVLNLRFSESMAIMLSSGIPILKALDISKDVIQNTYAVDIIQQINLDIKNGYSFSKSLENKNFFDPMLISMANIGDKSGNLDECLNKVSSYFTRELEILILRMEKLIEPIITLVLGIILGFIMLAIMLPTFYLINVI